MSPLEASASNPTGPREQSDKQSVVVQTDTRGPTAGPNTLGGMQWSVAEEPTEKPNIQTDDRRQATDTDVLGGVKWNVAQEPSVLDKEWMVGTPPETRTESTTTQHFNPEITNPQDTLSHLQVLTTDIANADIQELLTLHKYLSESSQTGDLANNLLTLDQDVFQYMEILSQEVERRDARQEQLSKAASAAIAPELAGVIAQAETMPVEAASATVQQITQGETSQLTTQDGSQYSAKVWGLIAAFTVFDCMMGGDSIRFVADQGSEMFMVKVLGINPDFVRRMSKDNNMSRKFLDTLDRVQLNKWVGETLKGREIYGLLECLPEDQRKKMMAGETFRPLYEIKEPLLPATIVDMYKHMADDKVPPADLAKLGLSYPTATT